MSGEGRAAPLARVLLLFAGLLTLGRLASRAWFEGPDLDAPAPQGYASPASAPRAGARPSPFLLAIVDGLREDATRASADPVMPFWRSLAREGASGVALTGEPTLTAACVRTLLTGRNPDLAAAARNFDAPVVRENLVQRVAEAGLRVGHAGDAAAWQFARPWYAPDDVFAVPDQGPADQGGTDDRAVPFALARIAAGVDALTIHLTRPDHAGHAHGADLEGAAGAGLSPYAAACRTTDDQLRAVVEAFRARHPGALVVVAADHGLTPRGTHGGGETGARRAPFVAAGPVVAAREGVELSQASLASTIAALLRVAPLPFAEGAPALDLTRLLPVERRAALEAYVNARLAVAASTGARDLSEAIAVRRAAVGVESTDAALARLASEAATIDEATASSHDPRRVGAALAFAVLVWLAAADRRPFRDRRATYVASGVAAVVTAVAALAPPVAAALVVSGGFALEASRRQGPLAWRAPAVVLLVVPVVAAGAFALVPVLESPAGASAAAGRLATAGAALAAVAVFALSSPRVRDRLRALVASSPGALLVGLGVAVGVPTSLRPFVDPFVDLSVPYAAITLLVIGGVCLARGARAQAPRARVVLLVAVAAALLAPRLPAGTTAAVAAVGLALVVALVVALAGARARALAAPPDATASTPPPPPPPGVRGAGANLAVAAATVALAAANRLDLLPGPVPFLVVVAAALATLAAGVRARGDGALAVRILAALALAVLLERHDDDRTARFALLALGAFAAGRLPGPSTSAGRIAFAAALALARIAAFHALGYTESLSTVDTGAGVVPGLDLGPSGSNALTAGVLVNVALQLVRFALPWLLLLAAAARVLERRPGDDAPRLAQVTGDLAGLLAVRGAALVVMLAVWWKSAWWVPAARAVYAFAFGDLLLVLGTAACCGAFARAPRGTGIAPLARA